MQFISKGRITGAKYFKDTIDGKSYDSTTIYVEVGLDERSGSAKGSATTGFAWGDSANYQRIKHLPFPFEAELTYELLTNGKGQSKQVLVDIKPLNKA